MAFASNIHVPLLPRLPEPPTMDELRQNTPRIEAVAAEADRPFWSVMIPTFNRPGLLREALDSVLQQDPGRGQMQIQVLDNGTSVADIKALVDETGGGRVEYFQQRPNIAGAIFTECIRRARGRWIHILHDDDMVMPGFYDDYREVIEEEPDVVMITGQAIAIDEHGRWLGVRGTTPNIGSVRINDMAQRLMFGNCCEYVSTVVRRDAYERTGGFCTLFNYVSNWELWCRISQLGAVAAVAQPRALYRIHGQNGANCRIDDAADILEIFNLQSANAARAGDPELKAIGWRLGLAEWAERCAWIYDARGSSVGRLNHARWAWMLNPSWHTGLLLAKSWLKHKLRSASDLFASFGRLQGGRLPTRAA